MHEDTFVAELRDAQLHYDKRRLYSSAAKRVLRACEDKGYDLERGALPSEFLDELARELPEDVSGELEVRILLGAQLYLEHLRARGVPIPAIELTQTRSLSRRQFDAFLQAASEEAEPYGTLLALVALTGIRASVLRNLTLEQVVWDRAEEAWTIVYGARRAQGEGRKARLSRCASALLRRYREGWRSAVADSPWLFPNGKTKKKFSAPTLTRHLRGVQGSAGLSDFRVSMLASFQVFVGESTLTALRPRQLHLTKPPESFDREMKPPRGDAEEPTLAGEMRTPEAAGASEEPGGAPVDAGQGLEGSVDSGVYPLELDEDEDESLEERMSESVEDEDDHEGTDDEGEGAEGYVEESSGDEDDEGDEDEDDEDEDEDEESESEGEESEDEESDEGAAVPPQAHAVAELGELDTPEPPDSPGRDPAMKRSTKKKEAAEPRVASTLRALLPDLASINIRKRMGDGKVASIGDFSRTDFAADGAIEPFLIKRLVPIHGGGEYLFFRTSTSVTPLGYLHILAPPQPSPLDHFNQARSAGMTAEWATLFTTLVANQNDKGSDYELRRLREDNERLRREASFGPPGGAGMPPPPMPLPGSPLAGLPTEDPYRLELLEERRRARAREEEERSIQRKELALERQRREAAESELRKAEIESIRKAYKEAAGQEAKGSGVAERAFAFAETEIGQNLLMGFMAMMTSGQLPGMSMPSPASTGPVADAPAAPPPFPTRFPVHIRPLANNLSDAPTPQKSVEAFLYILGALRHEPEWRPWVTQVRAGVKADQRDATLQIAWRILKTLWTAGYITESVAALAVSACRDQWEPLCAFVRAQGSSH